MRGRAMSIESIEARAEAAPLTEEELGKVIQELRYLVNISVPDEEVLLDFGLIRLLATLDALLAQLRDREEKLGAVMERIRFHDACFRHEKCCLPAEVAHILEGSE